MLLHVFRIEENTLVAFANVARPYFQKGNAYESMNELITTVLKKFSWRRVSIVSCFFNIDTFEHYFDKHKLQQCRSTWLFSDPFQSLISAFSTIPYDMPIAIRHAQWRPLLRTNFLDHPFFLQWPRTHIDMSCAQVSFQADIYGSPSICSIISNAKRYLGRRIRVSHETGEAALGEESVLKIRYSDFLGHILKWYNMVYTDKNNSI